MRLRLALDGALEDVSRLMLLLEAGEQIFQACSAHLPPQESSRWTWGGAGGTHYKSLPGFLSFLESGGGLPCPLGHQANQTIPRILESVLAEHLCPYLELSPFFSI